jgi:hypothetical protein
METKKKVYPAYEITHLWANQSLKEARTPNHNFYFEGPEIYSYGSHYCAAKIINEDTITINCIIYSKTTSKHMAYIKSAIDETKYKNLLWVPRPNVEPKKCHTFEHNINIDYYFDKIKELSQKLINARQRKSFYICEIERYKRQIIQYCETFKCKNLLNTDRKSVLNAPIENLSNEIIRTTKKRKEANKRKAYKKKREDIKKFLNSKISYINSTDDIYLRLDGDNILTSKGVQIPVERCKELWPLIQRCVTKKVTWKENGKNFKIAYYRVNEIKNDGTVKAGCHTIRYEILKDMAKQLNLI